MELYSRGRARRALFHTVVFRAVSQLATMLSFVVLVRGLSEQSLGLYSLLYSVIPVITTLASLGLDQVLRRYQPEYLQAGNVSAAHWLLGVVIRVRLISNLVLIGLLLLAWNLVAPVFHLTDQRANFALFSIVVVLYFQTNILQSSLASHMLQSYSVGSVALLALGKLAAYSAIFKFFRLRCVPQSLLTSLRTWWDTRFYGRRTGVIAGRQRSWNIPTRCRRTKTPVPLCRRQ